MLNEETLYRLYVTEMKAPEEIAEIAHVQHAKTVKDWLRRYNIPLRQETYTPTLDKETLYNLYVHEQMTAKEIAVIVGVSSPETIFNWMRYYDIPRRGRVEAQRAIQLSKEELYELYVVQHLSIDTIQKQVGSSETSIHKMLRDYDIPIRDKSEHLGGWNKGQKLSEHQRKQLSEAAKERTGEKSPRYGARLTEKTRKQIAGSLKGKYRRHLNPNWKDGGTTRYRRIIMGQYEYNEWRKAVYERDNYTCQMCHKPSNGDIEAHHIYPVKTHPERILDVRNGITLCIPCHRTIHGKEAQYITQLEAILHPRPPTQ